MLIGGSACVELPEDVGSPKYRPVRRRPPLALRFAAVATTVSRASGEDRRVLIGLLRGSIKRRRAVADRVTARLDTTDQVRSAEIKEGSAVSLTLANSMTGGREPLSRPSHRHGEAEALFLSGRCGRGPARRGRMRRKARPQGKAFPFRKAGSQESRRPVNPDLLEGEPRHVQFLRDHQGGRSRSVGCLARGARAPATCPF